LAPVEAAQMQTHQPEAMRPRDLQTMTQVAGVRASTFIFLRPMDLIQPLLAPAAARPPS
jgi:hypothetical protein